MYLALNRAESKVTREEEARGGGERGRGRGRIGTKPEPRAGEIIEPEAIAGERRGGGGNGRAGAGAGAVMGKVEEEEDAVGGMD